MTTEDLPIRCPTQRVEIFHDLQVRDLPPPGCPLLDAADPAATAWRLAVTPVGTGLAAEETFETIFRRFLGTGTAHQVPALVIGAWNPEVYSEDSSRVVHLLAASARRLPNLRALFLGELIPEEAEISWIGLSAITPLLRAYPQLEELVVRGGYGLTLEPLHHAALRRLRCESGGVPGEVVRAVSASEFPALDSLDLWLGTPEHGSAATADDLAGLLSGARLPALRHLGLRGSAAADTIAAAVAGAPVVAQLRSLSLATGGLGDHGAQALLAEQSLAHLDHLDLRDHALSPEMADHLAREMADQHVAVDLSGHQETDPVGGEGWLCAAVDE